MTRSPSTPSHILALRWLAAATLGAALFGAAPAVWEIAQHLQYLDAPGSASPGRWTFLLMLIGSIETAYGIYLFQLPDWASVRVVTCLLLSVAGFYAMGLAIVLIANPSGWLVGSSGLQLADKLAGGKAALWCLCMVSLSAILAFFAGRLSSHWQQAEIVRRQAGL